MSVPIWFQAWLQPSAMSRDFLAVDPEACTPHHASYDCLDGRLDQRVDMQDSTPKPLLTLAYQSRLFTGISSSKAVQEKKLATKDCLEMMGPLSLPAGTQPFSQVTCEGQRDDLIATWQLVDRDTYPRNMNPVMTTLQQVITHQRAECSPCAYYVFKQDRCKRDTDCDFCHLCTEQQIKDRRPPKKAFIRKKKSGPSDLPKLQCEQS